MGGLQRLFGRRATLHFNQSPLDKLNFIKRQQAADKTVMMVGDGLNDAGALQAGRCGRGGGGEHQRLFARQRRDPGRRDGGASAGECCATRGNPCVWCRRRFLISAIYNLVGMAIAASGKLSPVVCAILMPLSSVTVVAFCVRRRRVAGPRA